VGDPGHRFIAVVGYTCKKLGVVAMAALTLEAQLQLEDFKRKVPRMERPDLERFAILLMSTQLTQKALLDDCFAKQLGIEPMKYRGLDQ
jgi:hypothetical protein